MTEEIIARQQGRLGHLILNRPRALNALTRQMVGEIKDRLEAWKDDDSVQTVLVSGAGERGLCAGGDVLSVRTSALEGRPEEADEFFGTEYTMNSLISQFPKPYVAFMDGLVLGGGVGVSAHGSHRIVTERTRMGMPETGIGFFPDVGGTWLLSHTPSQFGLHLGLTGEHISGADACALGLADHYVPSDRLDELAQTLETTPADEAIAAVAEQAPPSELWEHRPWIDSAYAQDTAEKIVAALQDHEDPAAQKAAETILSKSPTSVKVTLAAIRRARGLRSLQEALNVEYRLTHHMMRGQDMPEGIRAQLVDKDRNPQWSPATLEEVSAETVDSYFAEPAGGDLGLRA